ncbi:MAG: protein translocase subunit SecF [Propionibacteriaceae bacterium]|jgi:preprotein translocase subunit SecF|nr:protein translocase subunit SecF [Propionibacteriaceae bacterium]
MAKKDNSVLLDDITEVRLEAPESSRTKVGFAHRLWTGDLAINFIGNAKRWYLISAILILASIAALVLRPLNLGIEFRGGSNFQVEVAQVTASTADDFRAVVLETGIRDLDATTVTTIGIGRVSIETRSLDVDEQIAMREAIAKAAGVDVESVAYQQIGASWGRQVTQQAGIALVIFLCLVALLIGIYFRDWKKALAAIISLLHDLTITVGVYALAGFSVTPATLTGVLTILGYSLYDTVVVFDKLRENTAKMDDYRWTYAEAANHSVNQVLVRSINTTVIGVLPVAALLFAGAFILGSGPLEDLGLSLFVGMIVAAYSSIFIATPLLSQLRMLEPGMKQQAMRVAKRRAKLAKIEASKEAAAKELR